MGSSAVEGTCQPVTISKKWKNPSSALRRKRTWVHRHLPLIFSPFSHPTSLKHRSQITEEPVLRPFSYTKSPSPKCQIQIMSGFFWKMLSNNVDSVILPLLNILQPPQQREQQHFLCWGGCKMLMENEWEGTPFLQDEVTYLICAHSHRRSPNVMWT